jgi:hypothetical protein
MNTSQHSGGTTSQVHSRVQYRLVKQQSEDDGTNRSKRIHHQSLWVVGQKEDDACEARGDNAIEGVERNN